MLKIFYLFVLAVILCIGKSASAQSNYINHTLKQGESLSALAKQYNTNVGDIMRINNMHADTKLVYGSVIKIPSAGKVNAATENIKPVAADNNKPSSNSITHKVVKGETLFSISKQYNVSVNDLKTWNHLANNSAQLGNILTVSNNNAITSDKPVTEIKKQRVQTASQTTSQPVNEPAQKTEINKTEDTSSGFVVNNSPNNIPAATTNENTNTIIDNITTSSNQTKNLQGYFADVFKKSRKEQHVSGISKTFKTASGWSDGKYYILADDINPGTIVKLTADNGNAVYAKVLWSMGDLKENSGVNFRISNATAAALNENNDAFNLTVNY